jgi:hypothetical protein
MGKTFFKTGNFYSYGEDNFNIQPTLDEGIYQLHYNSDKKDFYLEKIQEKFFFGFKLYGVDNTLIKHVVDTYNKQTVKRNIGVLLNGAKGTGKTVTAKLIANKIGLPVIICDTPYPGLAQFLSSINHDCIFFFDEFEKNFRMKCEEEDCAGEDLLSIMDGVYNSEHCHIFLLTTNELKVNDNLISRPSRIRYLKSFSDVISRNVLEEFIDDNLKYPEHREEIITFIESLSMATIDIIKSIVEEVNIHNCDVNTFADFFNVKKCVYTYYSQVKRDFAYIEKVSKKDFLNYFKLSYKERRDKYEWSPDFETIKLDIDIHKCKVGARLYGNWIISEIDFKNKYIYLKHENDSAEKHVYIENIDAKPNVYNDTDYIYGYSDRW